MRPEDEKSYEAEIWMAEGYEAMALAHRLRANAIKHVGHDHMDEDVWTAQAEGLFDEAEEDMRKAFGFESVHLARYSVDGSKAMPALQQILPQLLDMRHVLSTTSTKLWVPLSVMQRLEICIAACKEVLG